MPPDCTGERPRPCPQQSAGASLPGLRAVVRRNPGVLRLRTWVPLPGLALPRFPPFRPRSTFAFSGTLALFFPRNTRPLPRCGPATPGTRVPFVDCSQCTHFYLLSSPPDERMGPPRQAQRPFAFVPQRTGHRGFNVLAEMRTTEVSPTGCRNAGVPNLPIRSPLTEPQPRMDLGGDWRRTGPFFMSPLERKPALAFFVFVKHVFMG